MRPWTCPSVINSIHEFDTENADESTARHCGGFVLPTDAGPPWASSPAFDSRTRPWGRPSQAICWELDSVAVHLLRELAGPSGFLRAGPLGPRLLPVLPQLRADCGAVGRLSARVSTTCSADAQYSPRAWQRRQHAGGQRPPSGYGAADEAGHRLHHDSPQECTKRLGRFWVSGR